MEDVINVEDYAWKAYANTSQMSVLAGNASGCWLSELGAGMPYNREKKKKLYYKWHRVPFHVYFSFCSKNLILFSY